MIGIVDIIVMVSALSAVSIALYCEDPKWKRWSPVIGLLGQPFWIYSSFVTGAWGIFVVSIIYLGIWSGGIKKYWWTK